MTLLTELMISKYLRAPKSETIKTEIKGIFSRTRRGVFINEIPDGSEDQGEYVLNVYATPPSLTFLGPGDLESRMQTVSVARRQLKGLRGDIVIYGYVDNS